MRRTALATAAALACGLAAAPTADAAIRPAPRVAAAPLHFDALTPLDLSDPVIASPSDGVLYVAGMLIPHDTVVVRRYVRTATGVRAENVPVPELVMNGNSRLELVANGGATYLLAMDVYPFGTPYLFRLDGTTATPVALPDLAGVAVTTLAVDAPGSLWLGGNTTEWTQTTPRYGVTFHSTGSGWTRLPARPADVDLPVRSVADHGHLYSIDRAGDDASYLNQRHVVNEWTGAAWVRRPEDVLRMDTAGTQQLFGLTPEASGYSLWGAWRGPSTAPGTRGLCKRVVNGQVTTCPAPAWDVNAAVRLADGRVVLGGADGFVDYLHPRYDLPLGGPAGGFALVPKPGAAPVAISGDSGDVVTALAAPSAGRTVWAVTVTKSVFSLQAMDAGTPVITPPKKHFPTPNPPRRHCHPRHR